MDPRPAESPPRSPHSGCHDRGDADLTAFVAALPQAELHLHLAGSAARTRYSRRRAAELTEIARTGARAASYPEATRAAILSEIDRVASGA